MIQIPTAIIFENPHVTMRDPSICAILLGAQQTLKGHDVLHTMHCLEIVLSGCIKIGRSEFRQVVPSGSISFRKRGSYQLDVSDDYSSLVIFMDNGFIRDFMKEHVTLKIHELVHLTRPDPFNLASTEFIRANVTEIINHIRAPQPYSCRIFRFAAHQILLQLLSKDYSKKIVSFLHELVREEKIDIGYFMEANFTRQLSISEMARLTARSVSVFKKEFVNKFNVTPMKWQINRRLEYAHFLIDSTIDSVSSIAYRCGFENISHFSKAYKQKYGIAPSKGRRICRVENVNYLKQLSFINN